MESSRLLRFLRIVLTALGLTVCALLVALWVRSYWWVDALYVAHSHCVVSMRGLLYFDAGISRPAGLPSWEYHIGPLDTLSIWNTETEARVEYEGVLASWPANWTTVYPIWIFTLLATAFAAAPWIRYRFSLRTLLIATTLVAVGLGLVVALS
jgi:hypothetical protein